jgi:regulator of protease activity HflC (stomatin/prohibitin superfamily)
MKRAMAAQAEAERERRAKVINAEAEFQAAERLKDAALVMANHPIAIQLRYLQTLLEIGATDSSLFVFPAPIELLRRSPAEPDNQKTADSHSKPGAGTRVERRRG